MSPKHDHRNLLPTAETLDDAVNSKKSNFSQDDADHPPDSYWLSKDAEFDWFVRNAFFERNYSTKAKSNSASTSLVPKQLRKSESSIIWIPKTQRRTSFPETKLRRAPPPIRLVPRRSDVVVVGGGKTTEPTSPTVSCTGRVRQKKNKPAKKTTRSRPDTASDHRRRRSSGLWTRLQDVFRSGKLRAKSTNEVESLAPAVRWRTRRSKSSRVQMVEPVSLTRFASGRKSDSWIAELKTAIEEVDDTPRSDQTGLGLWSRRDLKAPEPLDCRRDWLDSGPASV